MLTGKSTRSRFGTLLVEKGLREGGRGYGILVTPAPKESNAYFSLKDPSEITPAKDGKPVTIELIDAKTKEPKDTLEEENKILDKMHCKKVVVVEKVTQTVRKLEEVVHAVLRLQMLLGTINGKFKN